MSNVPQKSRSVVYITSERPETVFIAEGAIHNLSNLVETGRKALLVTDEFIFNEYKDVIESIIGDQHRWYMIPQFNQVISTDPHDGKVIFGPPDGPITDVTEFGDVDIIIGFGGGRSIDAAKLLARESNKRWVSVPTAASHDGIASDVASVMQNGYRYSEKCRRPIAIVADLSIIAKAPPRLELAGLGDIVCKVSSLGEWRLAHEHNDEPFDEQVYDIMDRALHDVLNNYSLKTLVSAEIEAGRAMCMFGSSRPCSGTEHAISHAMDRRGAELHGIQVAFATPFCTHYLHETGYSQYNADEILSFMKPKGFPTTLEEMKLSQDVFLDDIHHALKIMGRRGRYSVLRHLDLNDSDILKGLQKTGY